MCLLWYTVGPASLACAFVMAAFMYLQVWIARRRRVNDKEIMEHVDARSKLMTEIINGIKVTRQPVLVSILNGLRTQYHKIGLQSFANPCSSKLKTPSSLSFTPIFFVMVCTVCGRC